MSGVVASLSWGVMTTRTCYVDLGNFFRNFIRHTPSTEYYVLGGSDSDEFSALRFNTSRFRTNADQPAFHFGS